MNRYPTLLINLSSSSYKNWPVDQYEETIRSYEKIVDMTFPDIDPKWSRDQVAFQAEKYYIQIRKLAAENIVTVLMEGELTFCFQLLLLLKDTGVPCVVSTNKHSLLEGSGQGSSSFSFHQYRHCY